MADPRYRKGIFQGNPTPTMANTLAIAACHPLSHGWQKLYHNYRYDLPVYCLGERRDVRLMKHPDCPGWLVQIGDNQPYVASGQMSEITARVKETLAEVETTERN